MDSVFLLDDGADPPSEVPPCFSYVEIFEDNSTFMGISSGNGTFREIKSLESFENASNSSSFSVYKHRGSRELRVSIRSNTLSNTTSEIFKPSSNPNSSSLLSLKDLCQNYLALKSLVIKLETQVGTTSWPFLELQLFVVEFMLDKHVFESFGFEDLYAEGIISADHWRDIQNTSAQRDLDDLDRDFLEVIENGSQDVIVEQASLNSVSIGESSKDLCFGDPQVFNLVECPTELLETSQQCPNPKIIDDSCRLAATPLHIAVQSGDEEKVAYLLAHGTNVDAVSWLCDTPLLIAIEMGFKKIMELLLRNGADPNFAGDSAQAPLGFAITHNDHEAVDLLLRHGADVEIQLNKYSQCCIYIELSTSEFRNRYKPLALACEFGNPKVIKKLLSWGAKINHGPNARCGTTSTRLGHPVAIALKHGHENIAKLLLLESESSNGEMCEICSESALILACQHRCAEIVRMILQRVTKVSRNSKIRILHLATISGNFELIQDLKNRFLGNSPLSTEDRIMFAAAISRNWAFFDHELHLLGDLRKISIIGHSWGSPYQNLSEGSHRAFNSFRETSPLDFGETSRLEFWGTSQLDFGATSMAIKRAFQVSDYMATNACDSENPVLTLDNIEREKLLNGLREAFRSQHEHFIKELPISEFWPLYEEMGIGDLRAIWKLGIQTLRHLLKKKLPTTLGQVISCLIVARAMDCLDACLYWGDSTRSSKRRFDDDTHRWRMIVPVRQQADFDVVISRLWEVEPRSSERFTHAMGTNLFHLQQLVASLIQGTGLPNLPGRKIDFGEVTLQEVHRHHSNRYDTSNSWGLRPPLPTFGHASYTTEGASIKEVPPICDYERTCLPTITILFAGAIIGLILAFFLALQSTKALANKAINYEPEDWSADGIVRRNCQLLALYLGICTIIHRPKQSAIDSEDLHNYAPFPRGMSLSIYSLEDQASYGAAETYCSSILSPHSNTWRSMISGSSKSSVAPASSSSIITPSHSTEKFSNPNTESVRKKSPAMCPHCNKNFLTITNRNRHMRLHCTRGPIKVQPKFPCRLGPCKPLGSEDYRVRHENERCPYRLRTCVRG